jgi:hypothetical protein
MESSCGGIERVGGIRLAQRKWGSLIAPSRALRGLAEERIKSRDDAMTSRKLL